MRGPVVTAADQASTGGIVFPEGRHPAPVRRLSGLGSAALATAQTAACRRTHDDERLETVGVFAGQTPNDVACAEIDQPRGHDEQSGPDREVEDSDRGGGGVTAVDRDVAQNRQGGDGNCRHDRSDVAEPGLLVEQEKRSEGQGNPQSEHDRPGVHSGFGPPEQRSRNDHRKR
jgi:hypothetical protein